MSDTKKHLNFNGKPVYFTLVEGTWWVAIKPICEALKTDYTRQFKNLKQDEILSQPLAQQPIVDAGGKVRKMLCLPEFFVYGWIFKINSSSQQLKEYQWKCYELLYNYFHHSFVQRNKFLIDKVQVENDIESIEKDLMKNTDYLKLKELKTRRVFAKKALDKLDKELVTPQIQIFN